jgi:flagellar basal body rod protein FlgB
VAKSHGTLARDELIRDLIGSGTLVQGLRDGLDASAAHSREIAHRVANASNETAASFDVALDDALGEGEVDLEKEMVGLADEQIRFEAMSEILSKMYVQIRSSIRGA